MAKTQEISLPGLLHKHTEFENCDFLDKVKILIEYNFFCFLDFNEPDKRETDFKKLEYSNLRFINNVIFEISEITPLSDEGKLTRLFKTGFIYPSIMVLREFALLIEQAKKEKVMMSIGCLTLMEKYSQKIGASSVLQHQKITRKFIKKSRKKIVEQYGYLPFVADVEPFSIAKETLFEQLSNYLLHSGGRLAEDVALNFDILDYLRYGNKKEKSDLLGRYNCFYETNSLYLWHTTLEYLNLQYDNLKKKQFSFKLGVDLYCLANKINRHPSVFKDYYSCELFFHIVSVHVETKKIKFSYFYELFKNERRFTNNSESKYLQFILSAFQIKVSRINNISTTEYLNYVAFYNKCIKNLNSLEKI